MPGLEYILVDIGSTTTKALALGACRAARPGASAPDSGVPDVVARADHPTTVEAPLEDAFIGFERAVRGLGYDTEALLATSPEEPRRAGSPKLMFTSSAAGGLKILAVGLVRSLSAESAEKASMGAGGVILDVVSVDDGRTDAEKADAFRSLRPDLVLVAGGFEGSRGQQLVELCEILAMGADPAARLPLIYAGTSELAAAVEDVLAPYFSVHVVPNLRPAADEENFAPVTVAIQDLFMNHVMAHAPGYDRIRSLAHLDVVPTPLAAGRMISLLAAEAGTAVLAVDIGGATTDVFSVVDGRFHRTVSANLGMSYSLGNTLIEAGLDSFARWITPRPAEKVLRNAVYNKVASPTRLPVTDLERQIDAAGGIEALRLALEQHVALTRSLPPVVDGGLGPLASREDLGALLRARQVSLRKLDVGLIIGSGGCLAHAPSPREAARIIAAGLAPEGVTRIILDTYSALSHFGNLSRDDPDLALALCRRHMPLLATVVAPVGRAAVGAPALRWSGGASPTGQGSSGVVRSGESLWLDLPPGRTLRVRFEPAPGLDVGSGPGRPLDASVEGAEAGLLLDASRLPSGSVA